MTTPNLCLIPPKDLPYIWPDVKNLLDKSLSQQQYESSSKDILVNLMNGDQVLWVGIDKKKIFCAGVTEFCYNPQKKSLNIVAFASKSGHDYELWKDFIYTLEDFGAQYGCAFIEATVRKGLAKKLKWDHEYSVITKTIKNRSITNGSK